MRLFEFSEIPRSFWINANTLEVVNASDEHAEVVRQNPEKFGLSNDDVIDGWSPEMMEKVGENGWVRGGKEPGSLTSYFVQGVYVDDIRKAAKFLYDNTAMDELYFDNFLEEFSSRGFNKVKDKELKYWLKTGNFLPRQR